MLGNIQEGENRWKGKPSFAVEGGKTGVEGGKTQTFRVGKQIKKLLSGKQETSI